MNGSKLIVPLDKKLVGAPQQPLPVLSVTLPASQHSRRQPANPPHSGFSFTASEPSLKEAPWHPPAYSAVFPYNIPVSVEGKNVSELVLLLTTSKNEPCSPH